jgi:glycosyltransferase involved in cell wall biosynthesis
MPRRLLVPDENVPWAITAVRDGIRLGRREHFDAILTTSPPSSVNLIGYLLSRRLGIPWIADLRDSLVAKEDRRVERMVIRLKERSLNSVASIVARNAAAIVGVTPSICTEIERHGPRGRVALIPNGADFDDFDGLRHQRADRFRITHTGSFFGQRSPRPFLQALAESKLDVVARFVGDFRAADRDWADALELGDRLEIHPFVSHRRSLEMQRDSEALLLLLPELGERGKDIPSGKLFEYVASQRPILGAVPPDGTAAALIREGGRGIVVPPDDVDAMRAALETFVDHWKRRELDDIAVPAATQASLSRRARSEELAQLVREVVGNAQPGERAAR